MAHTSTTVTAPVSFADVNAVLVKNYTTLASLCKASQINPWAKYKPVRWQYVDNTKDPSSGTSWLNSDKTWNSLATWWKNTYYLHNCGFNIPSTDVGSLVDDLAAWTYEQPTGGANQPYRLTDFNQYYHGAVVPFRIDLPARIIKDSNVTRGSVRAIILDHPTINTLGLTLYDIFGTSVRLGIAVVKGSAVYSKTQVSPSDSLISLEGLQNYVSVGDTVKIVAFATTHNNSSWNGDDYTVYSLDAPKITFATSVEAKVIETLQTAYEIAVTGMTGTDRNVLRPGGATQNNGRVYASNRSSVNPTNTWEVDDVVCRIYKCSADGTRELYDTRTYSQSTAQADPSYVAHNDGPYNNISCKDCYNVVLPTLDPTQYYWLYQYTIEYVQIM